MQFWLAIVIGCLYSAGIYMILRRSLTKLIIGFGLLSHGANLLIFTAGGLTRAHPPIVPVGATKVAGEIADPLPQALILTAIVISFSVTAFALVLFHRVYEEVHTDDPDDLKATDT